MSIHEGAPNDLFEEDPIDLVVNLAESLQKGSSEHSKTWLINHTYQDWSAKMVSRSKTLIQRPNPQEESFERPLFEHFCEELRMCGAEISQEEQEKAFNDYWND